MPIINRQDAQEVGQYIERFFDATGTGRAQALRRLFVEKLDFAGATGVVSLANAPKNVALPPWAERIASMEGLNVVYAPLNAPGPDRVRKAEAAAAAKLIADTLHGDLLLVMTNPSCSQLHFISPTFAGTTTSLRRMIIERDLPRRTAVQQLSEIYHDWKKTGSIRHAVDTAFDVEAVTKRFFGEYKRVFASVIASVRGFGPNEDEAKKLFVQTVFNRLMFIYFLSRKGWLKFNGDLDYLNALRKNYPAQSEDKNFYNSRLKTLFFAGLNNPQSMDLSKNNPALHAVIGDVKFLNGGLFEEPKDDKRANILVPDEAIDQILHQLFDRFNFTVMESTPFDVEVAVDPEMLGKVFEGLVTGRHESGSYYTPRPVVSFMCREALKGYLETQNTEASKEAIAEFIDHKETGKLTLFSAPKIGEALTRVKVVDPACGSGAYLLGMMQELVELMTALYSAQLSHEAQDLYNLKLRIIEQNLYGADIDPFVVNIAMLRLWLSLAIDYDGPVPPPLPNLNFKIVCGDSLVGPDPNSTGQGDLFRYPVHQLANQLAALKDKHLREPGPQKERLKKDIDAIKQQLRDALTAAAAPKGVVDWRVEFAEVFDQNGGFDVAIANPPYVTVALDSRTRRLLRSLYRDTVSGKINTYRAFLHRGVQVVKEGGWVIYVTPSTWLTAKQSTALRQYLKEHVQVYYLGVCPESTQVFERVTQEVVISVMRRHFEKQMSMDWDVRIVDPVRAVSDVGDTTAERVIKWRVLTSAREGRLLTALDASQLQLLLKLERLPATLSVAHFFQGEVNLTVYGDHVSDVRESANHKVLVRGNDLEPFWARVDGTNPKGGWVLPSAIPRTHWENRRIVTQEVSNMLQCPRLFAAPLEPGYLCAHTVDYCLVGQESFDMMLAVLNSWVADFAFRSRSRTNHISVGELEDLPIPQASAWHSERMHQVKILLSELLRRRNSRPEIHRDAVFLEFQVAMMDLYGLSAPDQRLLTAMYRG